MPYFYDGQNIGADEYYAAYNLRHIDEGVARLVLKCFLQDMSKDVLVDAIAYGTLLSTPFEELVAMAITTNGADVGVIWMDDDRRRH